MRISDWSSDVGSSDVGGQKRARNFDSTVRKHRGHRRYGEMVGLLLCPRSQDPTCMVQGTMSGEIRNGLRALRLRATIHAPRHHVGARTKILVGFYQVGQLGQWPLPLIRGVPKKNNNL